MHTITHIYRLTSHKYTLSHTATNKHRCSYAHKYTGIHTIRPHAQNTCVHIHTHSQVNTHSQSLTDTLIESNMHSHIGLQTDIHICPQENTSGSPYAQPRAHKTQQNKNKKINLPVLQTQSSFCRPSNQAAARSLLHPATITELKSKMLGLLRRKGGWKEKVNTQIHSHLFGGGWAEARTAPGATSCSRALGFLLIRQTFSARAML